jgi:hypothetical protein
MTITTWSKRTGIASVFLIARSCAIGYLSFAWNAPLSMKAASLRDFIYTAYFLVATTKFCAVKDPFVDKQSRYRSSEAGSNSSAPNSASVA